MRKSIINFFERHKCCQIVWTNLSNIETISIENNILCEDLNLLEFEFVCFNNEANQHSIFDKIMESQTQIYINGFSKSTSQS